MISSNRPSTILVKNHKPKKKNFKVFICPGWWGIRLNSDRVYGKGRYIEKGETFIQKETD